MKMRIIPKRQTMNTVYAENVKRAVAIAVMLFQILIGSGQTLKSTSGIKGLNDGLVAYYPFNGNLNDASENSKDGTVKGTPEYLTGISGKGIRLEGTSPNFGMMEEVRIYNRALNALEIDNLYSYVTKPEIKTVKVITLSVTQPPELGFSVSNNETTITKGEWLLLGKNLVVYGGSGNYSYKWSPGKSLNDSTLLNPVAFPVDTTNYLLTVTDKNGCSFSVGYKVNVRNISVDAVIIPALKKLEVILFPNPNEGKFKIRLSGEPTEKIELSMFNSSGGWIKKEVIRNFSGEQTETFNLNLSAGVYTLKIETEKEVIVRQFIIN